MKVHRFTLDSFPCVYVTAAEAFGCGASYATQDSNIHVTAVSYSERSRADISQREVGVELWVGDICVQRSTRFEEDPQWERTARRMSPVAIKLLAPSKA